MIGETEMVDNFDVSLSSSFIRKKKKGFFFFLPDEARTERNVEIIYHSCLTNHVIVLCMSMMLAGTQKSIYLCVCVREREREREREKDER